MTILEVLVVVAILSLLFGLTISAVQRARESSSRSVCSSNLKQIAIAYRHHEAVHKAFPTGGSSEQRTCGRGADIASCDKLDGRTPATLHGQSLSWTYQILPFLDRADLWSAEEIGRVRDSVISTYVCPSRSPINGAMAWSDYGAVGGERSNNGLTVHQSAVFNDLPYMLVNSAKVPNGLSNTAMIAESRGGATLVTGEVARGNTRPSYIAGWGDNMVFATWWSGSEFRGAERDDMSGTAVDPNQLGSAHPGALNVVFGDGSVRRITYGVDVTILKAACCRDNEMPYRFEDL